MMGKQYPVVLSVAGSDSGGGAGIQADIKTISALGCYATTAITAVTVQNTLGVSGIHSVPADVVKAQIEAVLTDIGAGAVKIGMLHLPDIVSAVVGAIQKHRIENVVLDPVMVSTSGHRLIEPETILCLKEKLFPLALVVTPNLDEAGVLLGRAISSKDELRAAAFDLLQMGCRNVLLKGGHLKGEKVYDVLVTTDGTEYLFESDFIATGNVHGTGCTLSSAIASYLALGHPLVCAVEKARMYIYGAILHGRDVQTGHGNGPLNHLYNSVPMQYVQEDV